MKSIQINLRVTEPLRHIGACARISTPVAAANARENYADIHYAISGGGSKYPAKHFRPSETQ